MTAPFKAYDVRGIYGTEVTKDLAYRLGRAYCDLIHPQKVVVGHDMRPSSEPLSEALIRGLTEGGADVIYIGLASTDMMYFAVIHEDADGGVVITASHNPAKYNGFKFVREEAIPMGIESGLAEDALFLTEEVYCRDGFAYVHEIDRNTLQILSFQVNSFGAGIFGDSVKVLCTPILLTVRVSGSHHYLDHSLKDSCLSISDFYLGKSFSGSKGPLCDREPFNRHAKLVFLSEDGISSFNHNILYQIMNANYLCHHIAEVMGYAFGGLDLFWSNKQSLFFLSSGARFNQKRDKLYIDIIEDFSGEKMRGYSQIPHYAVLMNDINKFKEEFDLMEWEVTYRGITETFMLPVGYQKLRKKMFHMNVNVITTQHIIEQVLTEYYHRKNVFVVANTFQTLEYLSRAMVARAEGLLEEGDEFIKEASLCLGHYPERDFKDFYSKREAKYPSFISDYSHTMFFRPPVLS